MANYFPRYTNYDTGTPELIAAIPFTSNVNVNGSPTNLPGTYNSPLFIYRRYNDSDNPQTEQAVLRVQRLSNYTLDNAARVVNTIWALHDVQNGVINSNEWAILGQANNRSTGGNPVTAVGGYFQGNAISAGSPTWGAVLQVTDQSGLPDNLYGTVGVEIDHNANGTDAHSSRVMCDMVGGRNNQSGAVNQITYGLRIGGKIIDCTIANPIYLTGNFSNGLVTTAGTFTGSPILCNGFSVSPSGNTITKSVRGTAVAFANRPAVPVEGMLVAITDSTVNTWGSTITGGGTNHVLGYYDGTNWTVAAV